MRSVKCRAFIILTTLSVFICGCSTDKYKDDVSCQMLAQTAAEQLPAELDLRELDASFRDFYFGDAKGYDDCFVMHSAENEDISEIGVFHSADDESAADVENVCREYIADLQQNSRAFIASYAPKELTKLDDGEVRRYGRYVVYTVLDGADAEKVFEAVHHALEE